MQINISNKGNYPTHLKVLVGGFAGSGKTTFASTFPHPFFVTCHAGVSTLAKHPGIPYMEVEAETDLFTIKQFLDNPEAQVETLGYEIETLVIDSIDDLQRRLLVQRMKADNRTETKIEDWGWLGTRMNAIFKALYSLPMNLVITCRTNPETTNLMLQGAFAEQVHNYVDYALWSSWHTDWDNLSEIDRIDMDAYLEGDKLEFPKLDSSPRTWVLCSETTAWTHSNAADLPSEISADYWTLWDLHVEALENIPDLDEDFVNTFASTVVDYDNAKSILDEVFKELSDLEGPES